MKAVVFKGLHPPIEEEYGLSLQNRWLSKLVNFLPYRFKKPNILPGGSAIVEEEFIRKLLEYGSYEQYIFLGHKKSVAKYNLRISNYKNHERVKFVLYEDFSNLSLEKVILHGAYTAIDEMIHLRKVSKKIFWSCHGITHALSFVDRVTTQGMKLLLESEEYDCITCTSIAGKKALEGIFSQFSEYFYHYLKTRVVYRGQLGLIPLAIDTSYYYDRNKLLARKHFNLPNDSTVFLCLGRFSISVKMDIFPLIYTFYEKFVHVKKNAILIFAGGQDFPEDTLPQSITQTVELIAGNLGCSKHIRVYNNLKKEDKALLYSAADVFVSPSDSVQETFGLTIIEALASGLPVIASDWNGYRETIKHGDTGFLARTYWTDCLDHTSQFSSFYGHRLTHLLLSQSVCVDTNDLIKYMEILYDNPNLRREMSDKARAFVKHNYDWSCIIPKYEELWDELFEISEKKQNYAQPILHHGLSSLDYGKIFGHYPSKIIRNDDLLKISDRGYQLMKDEIDIYPLAAMDVYSLGYEVNLIILNNCELNKGIKFSDLLQRLSGQISAQNDVIIHYVMRLVKYGILEVIEEGNKDAFTS